MTVFSHKEQEMQERRYSWREELELEIGVRGQESGVRSWSSELELESGGGDLL